MESGTGQTRSPASNLGGRPRLRGLGGVCRGRRRRRRRQLLLRRSTTGTTGGSSESSLTPTSLVGLGNNRLGAAAVRDHPYRTSAKNLGFFYPLRLSLFEKSVLFDRKIEVFLGPPHPSVWTSYLDGP